MLILPKSTVFRASGHDCAIVHPDSLLRHLRQPIEGHRPH
jgi:hypothetical protein